MEKFREQELDERLKFFENKADFEIELERSITAKMKLKNASICYDHETGFINIVSEDGIFKVNTTLVYKYETLEDGIKIDLETVVMKIKA